MKQFVINMVNVGQKLDSDKNTVDSLFGFWPGATKKELQAAEAQIGQKIPQSIQKFYRTTNGLSIKWRYRDPEQPHRLITGRSNFPNLDKLFNKKIYTWQENDLKEDVLWTSDANQKQIEYLSGFYILDDIDYGNYVLFRLPDNKPEPELYLYTYKNRAYRLNIDLAQYLNLLEKTLGMYFWQQYFVADAKYKIETGIPDNFHKNMALVMPETDLKPFGALPAKFDRSNYNSFQSLIEKDNYLHLFNAMIASLKKDNRFKKISFRPNSGVHEGVLRKIETTLQRELPADLLKFYFFMNGFTLSWQYLCPDTGETFYGNVNLLPLEDMFGVNHGIQVKEWNESLYKNIFWFDDSPDDEIEVLKALRRLEMIEGVSWDVTIQFIDEEKDYALYLWNRNECYRLEISFTDYIYSLSQTLGLHLWQLHLLDTDTQKSLNIDLPYYEQILSIFPQADLQHLNHIG